MRLDIMHVSGYRSLFNIFGSDRLSNAKIVCIIHEGSTPSIWEQNIDLVNQIWAGHSLLVGSLPQGEVFLSKHSEIFGKLYGNKAIQGWDIPAISDIIKEFNRIHGLIDNFEKKEFFQRTAGGWNSFLTNNPAEGCLTTIDEFLKLALPIPQGERQEEQMAGQRASLKKELFDYLERGHFEGFKGCLKKIIEMAKRHFNRSCSLKQAEISKSRQASLKEALIRELKKTNQKIIVFVEMDQLADAGVQDFLMKNKSVAFCSKLLPPIFPTNMEELWEYPEAEPLNHHGLQDDPPADSPAPQKLSDPSITSSLMRKSPTSHTQSLAELEFFSSN